MKRVVPIFPTALSLADFTLHNRVIDMKANTMGCELTVTLSHEQIAIACTKHKAYVQKIIEVFEEE
jgi:hypothetical protein